MENEEKKKKGIGKKVAIWIIGVIIVLYIIGCLDEDTTPTSSDMVDEEEIAITTNEVQEDEDTGTKNKTLLSSDLLLANDSEILFDLMNIHICKENYAKEKDLLNMGIKYNIGNKFFVYTVITNSQHETYPDSTLKSVLSSQEYQFMYYLNKNIPHYKIYYACYELNDNVYMEDIANDKTTKMTDIFNITLENIIDVDNGSDSTTQNYMLSQASEYVAKELESYYNKIK